MKLLRELRIEYGKTQEKMAAVLGTSRQVYANYENGINEPPFEILIKLADFFDCTTDYLLGREEGFDGSHFPTPAAELTKDERQLIEDYRALAPDLQEMIRATIQTWKGSEANTERKRKTP